MIVILYIYIYIYYSDNNVDNVGNDSKNFYCSDSEIDDDIYIIMILMLIMLVIVKI